MAVATELRRPSPPNTTTTYTVTITDANGCENTTTGTINVTPLPVAAITPLSR